MEIRVTGMTCGHCEKAVLEELGRIDGVHEVSIDLVPGGISMVTCVTDVPRSVVSEAIVEAGYDIVD